MLSIHHRHRHVRTALLAVGLLSSSVIPAAVMAATPLVRDSVVRTATPAVSGLGGLFGDLGGTLGNLGDQLGQFGDNLGNVLGTLNSNYVAPTPGTASEDGYIEFQGLARHFVLIRPETAVAGAPVLVLLHPRGLAPSDMANLTRAGRLAADYGAWVYLPEGRGGNWNSDPGNLLSNADDVGFIGRLVDTAVAEHGLDAKRVFVAGYSNGGAMAQRLGCELSTKFAGLTLVASDLNDSLAEVCKPVHALPVTMFNGTNDPIVPYNGLPGLAGARSTAAFWAAQSGCPAGQTTDTALPDLDARDGTRITLTRYTGCPIGTGIKLYTITGGGHTWPSSSYPGFTAELGRTTFDVDATLELWRVLTPFSLPGVAAAR